MRGNHESQGVRLTLLALLKGRDLDGCLKPAEFARSVGGEHDAASRHYKIATNPPGSFREVRLNHAQDSRGA